MEELAIDNINAALQGIYDGETEWTIDRNSGVSVRDVVFISCSSTSANYIKMLRKALKDSIGAEEMNNLNDLCDKYDKYAGCMLFAGIVESIEDSPDRIVYARIKPIVGFDHPIQNKDYSSFVSLNTYGSMTKLSGDEYKSLISVIFKYNPGIDLKFESSSTNNGSKIKRITKREVIASTIADLEDVNIGTEEPLVNIKNYSYHPIPEPRINSSSSHKTDTVYPRDQLKRQKALLRANNPCECNSNHQSFISKTTNKPYMETHHLIPLAFWESFDNSLDVEANIVSLCSNCHNEIHYGKYSNEIVELLFNKRRAELESAGILISIEQLLGMYNGDFIED